MYVYAWIHQYESYKINVVNITLKTPSILPETNHIIGLMPSNVIDTHVTLFERIC